MASHCDQHSLNLSEDILSDTPGALADPHAWMAQPRLWLTNLGKAGDVVLCFQAKWAESPLTFVCLILSLRLVTKLLEYVINCLRILHVNIVDHYSSNFLLLGDLSPHPSTIVVALSKQPCTLNKFALVAEPKALLSLIRFVLTWLLATRCPGRLNSWRFVGFWFIMLVGQVNLIKFCRWH